MAHQTITVDMAHNDTSLIKGAVLANSTAGKKSVVLNAKTYNTSAITMPDSFGLVGTSYITKLKKLPWSGGCRPTLAGSVTSDKSSER